MANQSKNQWNGFSLKPRKEMPDGLWLNCDGCQEMLFKADVESNLNVCPKCDHHFRINGSTRIEYLVDAESFQPISSSLTSSDPLDFKFRDVTYKKRLKIDEQKSKTKEAMHIGKSFIKGRPVIVAVMEPDFLMGSMGAVVGEKFCQAIELATEQKLPFVVVCCSGGARMHEGVVAVMQMAKTCAALAKFDEAGGLYITILTDPTTGGVSASFAMLGDVTIAEPKATIAFAGRRVIEQTIKVTLPDGFQTAEFLLEHGFVDMIVERKNLRSEIARLIDYCKK